MKKFISFVILIVIVVLTNNIYLNKSSAETKEERIASVLENAWDDFGLFSFQIGDTDSTIWIVMDDTKSESQLREYLNKKIRKTDLNDYNLEISTRSLEEVKSEHYMSLAAGIVFNYIKEKNYNDVEVNYLPIKPAPTLSITIPKTSNISEKDLKMELENLLDSKSSELPKEEISYEIQVIKE